MNKDNILDGMSETISLNKIVEFDGVQVINMTADVLSEPSSQMYYTVSVLNNVLYTENLEYFRKEVEEFKQVVQERENYLFKIYYPEKEEVVEEEPIEEGVEEEAEGVEELPVEGKPTNPDEGEPIIPDEEDIPEP